MCMSIRDPNHDPDDYWPLEDIRKAGKYVLNGTNPPILPSGAIAVGHASATSGMNQGGKELGKTMKQEDLAGILEKFMQQIVNVLSAKNMSNGPSNFPPANNFPSTSNFPNSGYLQYFTVPHLFRSDHLES